MIVVFVVPPMWLLLCCVVFTVGVHVTHIAVDYDDVYVVDVCCDVVFVDVCGVDIDDAVDVCVCLLLFVLSDIMLVIVVVVVVCIVYVFVH